MRFVRIVFVLAFLACGSKRTARDDAAPAPPADAANVEDAVSSDVAAPAAPVRTEHALWELVDNRHAAHRMVDGELVIDARHVSFARYTRFGTPAPRWAIGRVVDGVRASVPEALAAIEVPLNIEQAKKTTQLTFRVHAPDDEQRLEVEVNGKKASRVDLVTGWQTVAMPVEPGRFVVGENLVMFRQAHRGKKRPKKRPPLALAWLRFGIARTPDASDPRAAIAFDGKARTIELQRDAGLTWFVTLPESAHLVADVAPGCTIDVRARPSADAFAGGQLAGQGGRVDLGAMGGKVVALSLVARNCDRARITAPRITVVGPAPVALPAAPPPKYIVLWVMDALRADKVRTFTPGARAETPSFDELAKSSVVFRQYYVQGNESQTSHSSVWTGLYPAVHGVRLAGVGGAWKIDHRFEVIATELTKAGFYTAGVTGNGFVTADGGYTRGFKEFRNMMRETGVVNGMIYGNKIVDAALARLDANRANPTYLFFGTIDTHGPWVARRPWIDRYSPGPYDGPFKDYGTSKELGFRAGRMGCSIIPPPADIERLRAIYDSAVSYQDQQLGRFVEQLKSWGIWDETMLIVTADHGEEFFEDGRCGHGGSLRDSLVRVPLLIHDPSRFPGGTIVEEGAEGVDILPTILDAVGAAPIDAVQGERLAPRAQGVGKGWARPSYASMYEYAHAMRIGRWKIRVPKIGAPLIMDLVEDPDEKTDVLATRPVERRMLTDALGMFLALRTQWRKHAWGVVTNVSADGAAALDEATTP